MLIGVVINFPVDVKIFLLYDVKEIGKLSTIRFETSQRRRLKSNHVCLRNSKYLSMSIILELNRITRSLKKINLRDTKLYRKRVSSEIHTAGIIFW